MKYMLIIVGTEGEDQGEMSPEDMQEAMDVWNDYNRRLLDAGAFVAGEGLQPSATATTATASSSRARPAGRWSDGELECWVIGYITPLLQHTRGEGTPSGRVVVQLQHLQGDQDDEPERGDCGEDAEEFSGQRGRPP